MNITLIKKIILNLFICLISFENKNKLRKIHHISSLELDDHLNDWI